MKFKDYYETLGVGRGAGADEIKRAYRKLARKYHPDVSQEPDAEERFKEINEAYEVLKDDDKRKAYDQFGSNWKAGQDFRPPPGWDRGFDFGGGFSGAGGGDFSDFFESLFGRARGGGGSGFGGMHRKGEDLTVSISISLEDAYNGGSRSISLNLPERGNSGMMSRSRTLNVRIPKGVTEGQKIRLSGQGAPGMGGGIDGDLFLEVTFQKHPWFRAEGRDIHLDLPVTPWEAALGASVQVPTLGGKVELKVPGGSQSGQQMRLKGRGLPGSPSGSQIVTLRVVMPPVESDQDRELLEQMRQQMAFNPRSNLG
ncbi:MAG: DnaJ C-terminal domain-containing protein [Xanthomonadales bacterium]|nr:DnaJ C-terminal domain-containing protein [Xanthomonadales bacterium]